MVGLVNLKSLLLLTSPSIKLHELVKINPRCIESMPSDRIKKNNYDPLQFYIKFGALLFTRKMGQPPTVQSNH